MGKKGPCCHCGVTSTPLWRNGPPDKPILCNACGSRWRTKGSLANYTPLHSRTGPGELVDYRVSKVKNLPIKKNEPKAIKRKLDPGIRLVKGVESDFNIGLKKVIDKDISNHSSSGSAMSNDSCVRFGSTDTSDLTGPSQSFVLNSTVPSKKRTCINRPKPTPSPFEELTRDLYTILQEQQSSNYAFSCESDLLFESDTPMVSVEIGHGSVLIQHPSDIVKEEESVASSFFPVVKKSHKENEAYSHLTAFSVNNDEEANGLGPGIAKNRKVNEGMQHEQLKREKTHCEILQLFGNTYSSLCCVDLKEVLNFDEFERHLAVEEQQQLLQYLPFTDIAKQPDSLKDMFGSPQFKENISSFQKLLEEGFFDFSFSGVNVEYCKMVRKLALENTTKSRWIEQYNKLKEINSKSDKEGSVLQGRPKSAASCYSTNSKRPRDSQFQKLPGAKPAMKIPKRAMKETHERNEFVENDGPSFSPESLCLSPAANNFLISNSSIYMDESSDQDLLLEVPPNGFFPQAELLLPKSNLGSDTSTSNSFFRPR